jgi:hypothetical protein
MARAADASVVVTDNRRTFSLGSAALYAGRNAVGVLVRAEKEIVLTWMIAFS